MTEPRRNAHGQPIGAPLPFAGPWPVPQRAPLAGPRIRLEPADPARHAAALHAAYTDPRGWTYMAYGPFEDEGAFADWMARTCTGTDPLFFAAIQAGKPVGLLSYLRIQPGPGCIEIGHIHLAPALQRTPAATEALLLTMDHALTTLRYRRLEWKCDALNAPSRRAAERLGFSYEGTHRQATHYKGRSRDTAWYSILDRDWPPIRAALTAWLAPENFDAEGRQRAPLETFRA